MVQSVSGPRPPRPKPRAGRVGGTEKGKVQAPEADAKKPTPQNKVEDNYSRLEAPGQSQTARRGSTAGKKDRAAFDQLKSKADGLKSGQDGKAAMVSTPQNQPGMLSSVIQDPSTAKARLDGAVKGALQDGKLDAGEIRNIQGAGRDLAIAEKSADYSKALGERQEMLQKALSDGKLTAGEAKGLTESFGKIAKLQDQLKAMQSEDRKLDIQDARADLNDAYQNIGQKVQDFSADGRFSNDEMRQLRGGLSDISKLQGRLDVLEGRTPPPRPIPPGNSTHAGGAPAVGFIA